MVYGFPCVLLSFSSDFLTKTVVLMSPNRAPVLQQQRLQHMTQVPETQTALTLGQLRLVVPRPAARKVKKQGFVNVPIAKKNYRTG